jgi:hypothetical protein
MLLFQLRGKNMKKKIILSIISVCLTIATVTGCASLDRGIKDINSDIGGGLYRTVEVYDYSGNLLKTYTGKLDIKETATGNEVKFDLDGKRYIFYNAIVIVEEQ